MTQARSKLKCNTATLSQQQPTLRLKGKMAKSSRISSAPSSLEHTRLLNALESLLDSLPARPVETSSLRNTQLKELRASIESVLDRLQQLLPELDPIKQPPHVLDPSDPGVVGRLIAETLLVQDRHRLTMPKFYGSGVYALYYSGSFDAYQPIVGTETPIYLGKADPAIPNATSPVKQGIRLWNRLNDHRRSINAASNLDIENFECRFLVVKSAWQGTAETYLIDRFMPVWNNEARICYGFGKHGDDPGTRGNTRSPWDTLHPGREWATKPANVPYHLTPDEIKLEITEHYKKYLPQ